MNRIGFGAVALTLFVASVSAQDFLPPPEFGTVQDEAEPELKALQEADGELKTITGAHISAENKDESALLSKNGGSLSVSGSQIKKIGDSTNDGQSNFYGLNAAVVAKEGSSITLSGVEIESDADGSNAVFATGSGAKINAKNLKISTKQNSSRGLDATYGGEVIAENVDITTEGAHSAAFATDRGEGFISVSGGSAKTSGEGSPVIYSTGDISVKNITGLAKGSEIAVIEGKNSIKIENSSLEGSGPAGIMLYQSFSGDAGIGESSLVVRSSTLKSNSKGAFFYITNTKSKIDISNTNLDFTSPVLLRASGNNSERGWGRRGANGGTVDFSANNQSLSGSIECDEISAVNLNFGDKTRFSGAINSENEGRVNLSLSISAVISLTADSFVDVISDSDAKFRNIESNGHNLYYNKTAPENKKLKGKTVKLAGGGKLIGIEVQRKETKKHDDMPRRNEPMGEPFELETLSGTVKISGGDIVLVKNDESEIILEIAKAPKMDKKPEEKPDGKNMPMKAPNGKQGKEPPSPPKMLTEEELRALSGLNVELKGFSDKEISDKFIVLFVSKK